MSSTKVDASSVFLNIPFDKKYERTFVALIAALVAIGRVPRSVLEVAEKGEGRLRRIQNHLAQCRVSIHDLSRVGTPVRFNMPFELGLACELARSGKHSYILLERKLHRLDRTLSDLKGRDPYVYGSSCRRIVDCVLDALGPPADTPEPRAVYSLSTRLWRVAGELKRGRSHAGSTVFKRSLFLDLVAASLELAVEVELIDP